MVVMVVVVVMGTPTHRNQQQDVHFFQVQDPGSIPGSRSYLHIILFICNFYRLLFYEFEQFKLSSNY
jgi:hypothetical protein